MFGCTVSLKNKTKNPTLTFQWVSQIRGEETGFIAGLYQREVVLELFVLKLWSIHLINIWYLLWSHLDCLPFVTVPSSQHTPQSSWRWTNLSSLGTPPYLLFTFWEDREVQQPLDRLLSWAGCELAQSHREWETSNFKTALGQFNKLLPPPFSPHFWILKNSLPSKMCIRVEGFWNVNNAEFYSLARWILRG